MNTRTGTKRLVALSSLGLTSYFRYRVRNVFMPSLIRYNSLRFRVSDMLFRGRKRQAGLGRLNAGWQRTVLVRGARTRSRKAARRANRRRAGQLAGWRLVSHDIVSCSNQTSQCSKFDTPSFLLYTLQTFNQIRNHQENLQIYSLIFEEPKHPRQVSQFFVQY